jgi:hypothetical protein
MGDRYTPPEEKMEAIKSQLIAEVGAKLHDEWRAPREEKDADGVGTGKFAKRIKTTKDETWKTAHGTAEVDIANTKYDDLPEDWKGENKISAEVAIGEIYKVGGKSLDETFVEKASAVMHEKWLERNGSWAPAEQNKPYAELSDGEKEKDRVIIRKAIEIFKSTMGAK